MSITNNDICMEFIFKKSKNVIDNLKKNIWKRQLH
jgi:hypothetical protein